MTTLGIHEHNAPIECYSLHTKVGVGFPCLACALHANASWTYQRIAAYWLYWRQRTSQTNHWFSDGKEGTLARVLMIVLKLSVCNGLLWCHKIWINDVLTLQMYSANIWTWVQYCLLSKWAEQQFRFMLDLLCEVCRLECCEN